MLVKAPVWAGFVDLADRQNIATDNCGRLRRGQETLFRDADINWLQAALVQGNIGGNETP